MSEIVIKMQSVNQELKEQIANMIKNIEGKVHEVRIKKLKERQLNNEENSL